ncbi:ring-cleaving dioxygenase [Sporosarcina sp. Marseille-Q4063]|uniref:ring-cleaving dioxygenase n=1 Tax=Sporosarcina sp. Marseille-Q4063 TaxID=2810514 RepID=UPI001BAF27C2|nr:ring-cleaving dioxygenase [Sporosarcina sp. Marseille-Q4063]QUW22801.1 ring-cleaving dioxygenase [Sporosarcina sp. Marseille-Q4063]
MTKKTMGIHHITAIVGDPQENVDFYASVLGLRLVKKTVNFGDKVRYHLYFGNEEGAPGTLITFFAWPGVENGKVGDGEVGVSSYVVPVGAMQFWRNRLDDFEISYTVTERFGEQYLQFQDPHGLLLEIVEREEGAPNKWGFGGVTEDVAIKGLGGATLFSAKSTETADVVGNILGLELVGREGDYIRFKSESELGNIIDIKATSFGKGEQGPGVVHHIAWRTKDDSEQLEWKSFVEKTGFEVTPVRDRNYFKAIYFTEPGGILFEIATDQPGFAHDESLETMGEKLMLPKQFEGERKELENILIPVEVREIK